MKKYKRVEVTWLDIKSEGGWTSDAKIKGYSKTPPAICITEGILIVDEPDHIVLAGSYEPAAEEDKFGDVTYFPRGVLYKKIRTLGQIVC